MQFIVVQNGKSGEEAENTPPKVDKGAATEKSSMLRNFMRSDDDDEFEALDCSPKSRRRFADLNNAPAIKADTVI